MRFFGGGLKGFAGDTVVVAGVRFHDMLLPTPDGTTQTFSYKTKQGLRT